MNDFEREEIDRAIAISLSEVTEEDHKGKKVIGKIYAFANQWLKCCFVCSKQMHIEISSV